MAQVFGLVLLARGMTKSWALAHRSTLCWCCSHAEAGRVRLCGCRVSVTVKHLCLGLMESVASSILGQCLAWGQLRMVRGVTVWGGLVLASGR